jgi:hypothetical protein
MEVGWDEGPFFGAFGVDEFFEELIFLRIPGSFGFFFIFVDGLEVELIGEGEGFLEGGWVIGGLEFNFGGLFLWGDGGEWLGLGMLDFDEAGRDARLGGDVHGVWSDL